jgi:hypothetical protein
MPRRIYVVELDPRVWNSSRFRRQNGHIKDAQYNPRCVYVGQTGLSPAERFLQHRHGIKANTFVRRHGIRLLLNLMQERYWRPTRTTKEAERAEKVRADSLRKRGYAVYSR